MAETWLSTVAKTGNYNDLINKPETTSDINSESANVIATAKAVKTVYDKALKVLEASH